VNRNGVVIHYTMEGEGEPILFLAGGPGLNVDYFVPAAKLFPPRYRFVFIEQRGTGRSRFDGMNGENMRLGDLVDDVEAVRLNLKLEKIIVAGHSWGGMLAMAYATRYPNKLKSLVLIGSGGPTIEFTKRLEKNLERNRTTRGGNPYFHDRSKGSLLKSRGPHQDTNGACQQL
jgi:proline iminopeptidase